jgi:hypothetical protein
MIMRNLMAAEMQLNNKLAAGGVLNLLSIYTDFPASVRVRWTGSRIGHLAGQSWQIRSDIWKFDTLLASDSIKNMAITSAVRADILLVAIGSVEQRDENLIAWLDSVAAANLNPAPPKLLIGLLGAEDTKSTELDWNIKQLLRCSRAMGCGFIWHWMGQDAMTDADFLAEHVTDLLAAKINGSVAEPEAA